MKFYESVKKLFFPEEIVCIGCKNEMTISSEYGLCGECSIDRNTRFCLICGRGLVGEGEYCDECKNDKRYFDEARAPAIYDNLARKLILKLKIGGEQYLAKYLARFMFDTYMATDWNVDFMTFVPISKFNLKARGFNQTELLAKELSHLTGIRVRETLNKIAGNGDSAELSKKERKENIKDTFEAVNEFHGERVMLIDDIMTTGSTAEECAKVLKNAGVKKVFVLTFATSVCKPIMY